MKQILVISGKGGTGKTVLTGALAALAQNKVMADCDVDAANLYLLLNPSIREKHPFQSGASAVIDPALCARCGQCSAACRFDAISRDFVVNPIACEGCGLCARVCPAGAVIMKENTAGDWFISETRYGPFVHAKLGLAEENSGKLVAKVREAAREIAESKAADYVIIDGPPGIGCPVVASLSGVDLAVIVTEPSLSAIHDAERVMDLAKHFEVPVKLVVNKWDINPAVTEDTQKLCDSRHVPLIGLIPFDRVVVESVLAGEPVTERAGGPLKEEFIKIWEAIRD